MLFALASNGLTVRRTLLWNSSPRFIDLTSCLLFCKPLTVHRLVGHVLILQNDSNCNTTGTVLTRTRLACSEDRFSAKQRSPTWNTVLSFTAKLCDHQKLFYNPVFFGLQTSAFKFLRTTIYADMTLVMFQLFWFLEIFICNASKAFTLSCRCQQLRTNSIKSPIHAITGGQFTILQVVAFIGNGPTA